MIYTLGALCFILAYSLTDICLNGYDNNLKNSRKYFLAVLFVGVLFDALNATF